MRREVVGDRGSTIPLIVVMIVAAVLATAVLVDVAAVTQARRQLASTADAAALAGAQRIDLSHYYRHGMDTTARLTTDPRRAEQAVRDQLRGSRADLRHPGLRLETLQVSGESVGVGLAAPVRLPFAMILGVAEVTVRAHATARLARG